MLLTEQTAENEKGGSVLIKNPIAYRCVVLVRRASLVAGLTA